MNQDNFLMGNNQSQEEQNTEQQYGRSQIRAHRTNLSRLPDKASAQVISNGKINRSILEQKVQNTIDAVLAQRPISNYQQYDKEDMSDKNRKTYYIRKSDVYYVGTWQNGKPNGHAEVYFKNGNYFKGYYDHGVASGDGLFVFFDGSYYRGNFQNSVFHGQGKFFYENNKYSYDGLWKNDKPDGFGQQIQSDETIYKGTFQNGFKSGLGKLEWNDGKTYQGNFKDGYMHGQGILKKPNGGIFNGIFHQNLKKQGILQTKFGKYNGPFVNGQMQGYGTFEYYDGKIYEGQFKKGKLHGIGKMIYPNNQVALGQWQNGQNVKIDEIINSRGSKTSNKQLIINDQQFKKSEIRAKNESRLKNQKVESRISQKIQQKKSQSNSFKRQMTFGDLQQEEGIPKNHKKNGEQSVRKSILKKRDV